MPGVSKCLTRAAGTSDLPVTNRSTDDDKYDLWVATSVGELLAVLPRLESSCLATALRANLQKCLHQSEGATKENLAALARAGPCTFQTWISGRARPTLDHLCRLAYQLKLPLIQLFQGVPAEWRGPDNLGPDISRLRGDSSRIHGSSPSNSDIFLRQFSLRIPRPASLRWHAALNSDVHKLSPHESPSFAGRSHSAAANPAYGRAPPGSFTPDLSAAASKPFFAHTLRRRARHQ